jgi:hypothetical protein
MVSFSAAYGFQNTPKRDDVTITWDFGDGQTATGPEVRHAFATHGTYDVVAVAVSPGPPPLSGNDDSFVPVYDDSTGIVVMHLDNSAPAQLNFSYQAGWNLVSGPVGARFSMANGPLYTLNDDGGYDAVSNNEPIKAGTAYWAYFDAPAQFSVPGAAVDEADFVASLSAYAMLGNPNTLFPVKLAGVWRALAWDPETQAYIEVTSLRPGQGAWIVPSPVSDGEADN